MNTPTIATPTINPIDPRIAGQIAHYLTRTQFTNKDIAALKRMDPKSPLPQSFWQIAMRYGITARTNDRPHRPDLEEIWAIIIKAIAEQTSPGTQRNQGTHRGDIPFGTALATQGYHEGRINILLTPKGSPQVVKHTLHAVKFLGNKKQPFNWIDAARLIMTKYRSKPDQASDRMNIARSYYRTAQRS